MEPIFLKILNMSITATWLSLAVIVLRLLLKKAPKFLTVILWGFVAVRLCFPFSFESIFSLIPNAEPIPENIIFSEAPAIQSGVPAIDNVVKPILSGPLAPNPGYSVNPMQVLLFVASVVWVVGIAGMLGYMLVSYLQLRKKVSESARLKENIWICDSIDTPFILGIFKPQIYLLSSMNEQDMKYVIAHEKAHLKRWDHLWKPFGFLLLSVHWFNPVLWIAYVLLCRDIESACDEKVIQENGTGIKKAYSEALINCSVSRKSISACPLAFGEVAVKERVKGVLNYKKPAFWIIIVAVAALVITAVCLLTNPIVDDSQANQNESTNNENANNGISSATGYLFQNIITQPVDRVIVIDSANRITRVTESAQVDEIVSFMLGIQGTPIGSSKGWYGGDYIVKLMNGEKEVLHAVFTDVGGGAEDVGWFYYGYVEGDHYPVRYSYHNIAPNTVMDFFAEYKQKAISIASIVDKAESGDIATDSAIEVFYKDDTYTYSFSSIRSDYVIVTFTDGTEKTVKEALEAGEITIADLDRYDIGYMKEVIPTPGDPFRDIIDKATFDIDKDGKAEDCYLGYGPTSGLLTYKIYVSENGKGEYFDIFDVDTFLRNFIIFDGEWKVQGETHLIDIFIRDNNIVLSEDGKELEYWGEHDIDSDAVAWEWSESEIPTTEHPVIVSTNGESIEPYMHFAYSGEWEGSDFLFADGTDLAFKLPELVKEGSIPTITQSAGSEIDITLAPDRTFQCFYMFDKNFVRTELLYEPDALSNLEAGEYYVGIMFDKKGEYIEQVDKQEYWVWIGVFHLNVE